MKPILRFLQLLCENHNRDLQVSELIRKSIEFYCMVELVRYDMKTSILIGSLCGPNFAIPTAGMDRSRS